MSDAPPICQPCSAERARWLDYRLPRTLGITHGSGAPYDVSVAGVRDRQRSRFEEWKATIAFHRDLIAHTCRQQCHAEPAPEVVPAVVVVQLPLFELAESTRAAA
ncbi:hypothetical protein AB0K35_28270 [Micromonospora sp. NPDC053740]|uniref:hypothetical protein n=1 Tax=Micromonospora sp. NPDC053740 TaxID=3155173 RepID=UPI003432F8DD